MFFIYIDKPHIVYIHTNKINNKKYVGLTCQKPEYRWGKDGANYIECPYFWNAIQKYGWDNFEHTIYKENLSRQEAEDLEKELIKQLKTNDPDYGYNISPGGDSGTNELINQKWNDEEFRETMKQKMREAWKDPEKRKRRSEQAFARYQNEEYKDKWTKAITRACAKSVMSIENSKIYSSIKDAADELNVCRANISRSISKGYRCGGYHWKYCD